MNIEQTGIDSQHMLATTLPCIVTLICENRHLNRYLCLVWQILFNNFPRLFIFCAQLTINMFHYFGLVTTRIRETQWYFCVCEYPWFVYFLFLFTSFQSNQMSQGSGCQE